MGFDVVVYIDIYGALYATSPLMVGAGHIVTMALGVPCDSHKVPRT
jgi:hypothetical protein